MRKKSPSEQIPRFPIPSDPEVGLRAMIDLAILEEQQHGREKYAVRDALRSYLTPPVTKHLRRYFPDDTASVEHFRDEALDRIIERVYQCHSESHGGIISWAKTIAQNLAIDELRRRRTDASDRDSPPIRYTSIEQIERTARGQPFEEEKQERNEIETLADKMVAEAIEPFEKALEMLSLHSEGHYTWDEVGERFGISGRAAKERARRLRTAIPAAIAFRVATMSPADQEQIRSYFRHIGIEI